MSVTVQHPVPGLGKCETRGCDDDAVGFDEDGKAMCGDCLFEASCEQDFTPTPDDPDAF